MVNFEEAILSQSCFFWWSIFGRDWKSSAEDVLRYFVKHACCRMAADNILIPASVTKFLYRQGSNENFRFSFEIRDDMREFLQHVRGVHKTSIGNLNHAPVYVYTAENGQRLDSVFSFTTLDWLRISWVCDQGRSGG